MGGGRPASQPLVNGWNKTAGGEESFPCRLQYAVNVGHRGSNTITHKFFSSQLKGMDNEH
jgi:hypothetical protein